MNAPTFVAAGAAGSSDGGTSPASTLPAGLAVDDLLVCVFYSREVTDGTVDILANGWSQVVNDRSSGGLLAVWTKRYRTGDAAPTFLLGGHAGGVGGDDAITQIAAWRNVVRARPISVVKTNTVVADIGPIAASELKPNNVVVVIGGKLDDWTSVAVLSGDGLTWAEIGEPDTTAGADAGMVWDYAINGVTITTVTAKSFVVTGGVAAASKGVMLELLNSDDELLWYRRRKIHAGRQMMAGV